MSRGRTAVLHLVDDCLRIDLVDPAIRRVVRPGSMSRGSWTWTCGGEQTGAVGYVWNGVDAPQRLTLEYAVSGAPVRQVFDMAVSRPRFGGHRYWFVCPYARCRARVLYLPPGGRQFASRRAWRLTYRTRRESGAQRRLAAMFARIDALPPGASRWDDPAFVRVAFAALDEEAREERAWKARVRRNAVRRIRRRERRVVS